MKSLFNLITSLKKRWVDPKVYSIVLHNTYSSHNFLHLGMHYSLEEAIGAARTAAMNHSTTIDEREKQGYKHAHALLYVSMTVQKLLEPVADTKMSEEGIVDEEKQKNDLMQKIVEKKDKKLLEKNKDYFSAKEYQYLIEKINV